MARGFGRAPARLLATGEPQDLVGPVRAGKRHPLLQGMTLAGVVWAGALPVNLSCRSSCAFFRESAVDRACSALDPTMAFSSTSTSIKPICYEHRTGRSWFRISWSSGVRIFQDPNDGTTAQANGSGCALGAILKVRCTFGVARSKGIFPRRV